MGAKHITAQEKELFQVLVNSGLSMQKVATLTGRDAGTVSDHVTRVARHHLTSSDTKPVENIHLTQDEMFSMLDLHAQGMTCTQIGKEVGKAHGTVYKVINQLYPKHKKAHAKWLEIQKEKEAPALVMEVQLAEPPAVPAGLLDIRTIRTAHSASEPMLEEVQPQPIVQPEIDWELKWSETQKQIAHLTEINDLLKEHIKMLKSMR